MEVPHRVRNDGLLNPLQNSKGLSAPKRDCQSTGESTPTILIPHLMRDLRRFRLGGRNEGIGPGMRKEGNEGLKKISLVD